MENFFIDEEFYNDLGGYIDTIGGSEDDVNELDDEWSIVAQESSLEPIFELSPDWIFDRINEERFSEDGDERDGIYKALYKIDYASFNTLIPKMYYQTKKEFTITKADLLEYIK